MVDNPREHTLSEQLTLLYRSDPQFRALVDAAPRSAVNPLNAESREVNAYLASRGIQVPERFDFRKVSGGGQTFIMATQEPDKRTSWLLPAAMAAGAPLGAHFLAGLGGGGAAGGGAMAAENVAPFSGLPGAIPGAGAGAGAAAGAGLGGGILDTILKVAPVGAGLVSKLAGGGFGGGGTGPAGQVPPELTELLNVSMQRMRDQEPLFQAVTKQALAGLPTYAQGK